MLLVEPDKVAPLEGNDSNVGSAPLFALRNLPSLDDVPCSNLASVTDSSSKLVFAVLAALYVFIALANLSVVTASSAIASVLIFVNAISQLPQLCLF